MKSKSELKQQIVALTLMCCMGASSLATEPTNSQRVSPRDAKQQLLDLEKEWAAAEDKNDVAVLRRILDERFVATFGAKTRDKEAFIKAMTEGEVDPTASQSLTTKR